MRYNVLILDDEVSDRRDVYCKLEQEVPAVGCRLGIEYCENIAAFEEALAERSFDFILLDMILAPPPLTEAVLDRAVSLLPAGVPVGVISSAWHEGAITLLRKHLSSVSSKLMFTLNELRDPDGWAKVVFAVGQAIRESRRLSMLTLPDRAPVRIVHLSDFHFGMKLREGQYADVSDSLNNLYIIQKCREVWPDIRSDSPWPIILLLSGDIANTGDVSEYQQAEAWLEELLASMKLSLPSDRVLVCPGNHDCFLPATAFGRLKITADRVAGNCAVEAIAGEGRSGNSLPFEGFRRFARRISAAPVFDDDGRLAWVDKRFIDLGVVFFSINSSVRLSVDNFPSRTLDEADLRKIHRDLSDISAEVLRVGIIHHPPDPDSGARNSGPENVLPIEMFKAYSMDHFKADMWIHGHVHEARVGFWSDSADLSRNQLVVGAAAPRNPQSKQELDESRGFSLIEVSSVDGVKSVKVQQFSFKGGRVRPPEIRRFTKRAGAWIVR